MICENTRPSVEMIDKAFQKNPVGAGISWREKEFVRWKKGLEIGELQDLVAKVPLPFIAHCRIDTTGGTSKELTHPFAVNQQSPLILNGRTKGYMMFHNGTWHPWKDKLLEVAIKSNVKLPGGRWSDSRAMAFVASIYGISALELIDEKAAVLSPTDLQAYGNGWSKVNDIWVSNRLWESEHVTNRWMGNVREEVKLEGTKKIEVIVPVAKTGGSSRQETFRRDHTPVQFQEDIKKGVEASPQSLRGGHEEDPTAGERERTVVKRIASDGATILHSLDTPEGALKATEWVRGLNPSSFRRPLSEDSLDRERRKENARKGIVVLGKM